MRLGNFDAGWCKSSWEGLDLPEVSLVIILDADKEGFLSEKSLIRQLEELQEMWIVQI